MKRCWKRYTFRKNSISQQYELPTSSDATMGGLDLISSCCRRSPGRLVYVSLQGSEQLEPAAGVQSSKRRISVETAFVTSYFHLWSKIFHIITSSLFDSVFEWGSGWSGWITCVSGFQTSEQPQISVNSKIPCGSCVLELWSLQIAVLNLILHYNFRPQRLVSWTTVWTKGTTSSGRLSGK